MNRNQSTEAAHDLSKSMGQGPIAEDRRRPQEESLKHHGDELQNLVDKATSGTPSEGRSGQ